MGIISTGILSGAICAAIVWFIGYAFVSNPEKITGYGSGFAAAWRFMLRSALFLVTLVVCGLGALWSYTNDASWTMYTAWAATYLGGVFLYFLVRYGRLASRS